MATNILGKVSVVLKGDYAAASQYKQLDIVKYKFNIVDMIFNFI